MRGKFVYITFSSILGIIASFYSFHWYILSFLAIYIIWIWRMERLSFVISSLCFIIGFALYFNFVDNYNRSYYDEGSIVLQQAEIITSPTLNGDKLSLRLKTMKGEVVLLSYKLKTKHEVEQLRKLQIGTVCKLKGELSKPRATGNYFAFDYKTYLYRQSIHFIFTPDQINLSSCLAAPKNILTMIKQWRERGIAFIDHSFPDPSSGIVQALLFGERKYIDKETINAYQSFGLIHLLAISGLHVGLIIGCVFYIGIRLGGTRETVTIVLIIILPIYMTLAGGAPSVVRACFMTMAVLISIRAKSPLDPIDGISITAIIMLLYKPYFLLEVGFQLSFIVSFSLILSSEKLLNRYSSRVMQLFAVTTIAQLSSLPIILFHFFEVSLLSIPLNMIFVPFISLFILPFAIISTILLILFPNFLFLISFLTKIILFSQIILDRLIPYSILLQLGKPELWLVILYYIVIIFLFVSWEKQGSYKRLILPILLFASLIVFDKWQPMMGQKGEVTLLDVGQGDSIYIELPHRKAVYLIDTGGLLSFEKEEWRKREFDVGEDIVLPYLKAKGVTTIDKLIFTHGDYDHIGGSKAILDSVKVNSILVGQKDVFKTVEEDMVIYAAKKGITIEKVKVGDYWKTAGFTFYVLAPFQGHTSENNDSIVLFSRLGGMWWLFTGDLEKEGEQQLVRQFPSLNVDILKVGHHGSDTSSSQEFIEQIKPQVALISVGKNNRFGHPHKEVMDRFNQKKIRVLRTDKNGAIRFKFNKNYGTFSSKKP